MNLASSFSFFLIFPFFFLLLEVNFYLFIVGRLIVGMFIVDKLIVDNFVRGKLVRFIRFIRLPT
jgi:hypothetical protein